MMVNTWGSTRLSQKPPWGHFLLGSPALSTENSSPRTSEGIGFWAQVCFSNSGWAGLSPLLTLPSAPLLPFSEHLLPGRALSWSSSVVLAQALVAHTWHLHLPHLEVYDVCSNTHVASPSFANSGKGRCGHGTCHLFWALPAGPMPCACRNSEHKDGGAFFQNLVALFLNLRFSFQDPVVWGDFERICFWLVSFFFPFWRNWSNSKRI